MIIRGVKAGLPLGDCMRVIASESAEPVRTEFRLMVEATALGLSLGEATERIVERVPVPEASFFSIVVNIQQKAGGNFSEALSNLSRVLRDRKKLKQKVQAVSARPKRPPRSSAVCPLSSAFWSGLSHRATSSFYG